MTEGARRARRASGDQTRTRLLDAGAVLFARRGVDGVELKELLEASHSKNQSAVSYHFGDRAGLAAAIVERHLLAVEAARAQEVEELEAEGATADLRRIVEALVAPLAASFTTEIGRAQLRLVARLSHPRDLYRRPALTLVESPGGRRLVDLLRRATDHLPDTVQHQRLGLLREQIVQLVGLRAHLIDDRPGADPDASDRLWVSNLIDVLAAGLAAPASPTTYALVTNSQLAAPASALEGGETDQAETPKVATVMESLRSPS